MTAAFQSSSRNPVGRASDNPAPVTIGRENRELVFTARALRIPLLKEPGYSCGFFVNQIRQRLSRARGVKRFKVGHAGTLDPFADGVLLVLAGDATRLQDGYMKMPKVYEAVVRFGATTPSLDPETEINEEDLEFKLDEEALSAALPDFLGAYEQIPPAYSAKHVDGVRAYTLARRGETPQLEAKEVTVEKIDVLNVEGREARLRVACGSGFYVRSLARDLARKLGTVGYLSQLTRTHASGFDLSQCLKLRDILDAQPAS